MRRASNVSYIFPSLRFARIAEGGVEWKIGENTYICGEGDVILLNNLTARKMLAMFSPRLIIDVFEFSPVEIRNRPRLISAFYGESTAIVPKTEGFLLSSLLDTLMLSCDSAENDELIYHQLQGIFCLLENRFSSAPPGGTGNIAFEAANFIWEKFAEDISVPDVAEHLNISKSHLEKEFKKVHGICVGEYIRSIRIYNVNKVIKAEPERSVLDIAFSCGFKSSSGFYKAYKAVTGSAPKKEKPLST